MLIAKTLRSRSGSPRDDEKEFSLAQNVEQCNILDDWLVIVDPSFQFSIERITEVLPVTVDS